ncbi:MAG TPA: hypothetical protein VJ798_12555 [Rhizomicrobium sp.]|nr:hypothetical protein [Rhizomicrobium sp.]
MRCYFVRDGRIQSVETLTAPDRAARIAQAHTLFRTLGQARMAEGFEVWDSNRCVYRFPRAANAGRKPRSVARLLRLWDRFS